MTIYYRILKDSMHVLTDAVRTVDIEIDLGETYNQGVLIEESTSQVDVALPWVEEDMTFSCSVSPTASVDHSAEEVVTQGVCLSVIAITPRVGITLQANCPEGSWGKHNMRLTAFKAVS